jgi:hypothetical protein
VPHGILGILYENEFWNPQIYQQTISLFPEQSTLVVLVAFLPLMEAPVRIWERDNHARPRENTCQTFSPAVLNLSAPLLWWLDSCRLMPNFLWLNHFWLWLLHYYYYYYYYYYYFLSRGNFRFPHMISDSIPRICRNDASKLAPSLVARHDQRLDTGNFFMRRPLLLFNLKPTSTVFRPNCCSNSRYGVNKSLWESHNMSTLKYYYKDN